MAGAEQLTADLADQRDFRQMLGFLAHHSRQEAPQEYSVFTEEPTEEGKEVAGGGASRQVSKGYFERFCDGVERTLRHNLAANQPGKDFADVEPVCIVDFAFGDENGLNLKDSDQLLERAHCFIDRHDRAGDTRLFVQHVHTMCKWSEAKHMPPRERVQKITSVNVRHAHQPRKRAPFNTTASTRAAAQRDQRAAEPRPVSGNLAPKCGRTHEGTGCRTAKKAQERFPSGAETSALTSGRRDKAWNPDPRADAACAASERMPARVRRERMRKPPATLVHWAVCSASATGQYDSQKSSLEHCSASATGRTTQHHNLLSAEVPYLTAK